MENTTQEVVSVRSLPTARQLFDETWSVMKAHWKNLARFTLLGGVLSFVFGLLVAVSVVGILFGGGFMANGPAASLSELTKVAGVFIVFVLVGVLVMLYLSLWIYTALFESLRALRQEGRDLSLKEAFRTARPRMWGFALVSLLSSLAILGGIILLIIPGIIFAIWFIFSSFVFMNENLKGRAALRQSKKYVSGRWGAIFGRAAMLVILFILVSIGISIISSILGGDESALGGLFNLLANIAWNIFSPVFGLIYLQLLYEAARTIDEPPAPSAV